MVLQNQRKTKHPKVLVNLVVRAINADGEHVKVSKSKGERMYNDT